MSVSGLPSLPRSWGHFHEPKLLLSWFLSTQEVHKAGHPWEVGSPFGWRTLDVWEAIPLPASTSAWRLLVLLCLTNIPAEQSIFAEFRPWSRTIKKVNKSKMLYRTCKGSLVKLFLMSRIFKKFLLNKKHKTGLSGIHKGMCFVLPKK